MERKEAQRRVDAAVAVLKLRGFTQREIEGMLDGLQRDETVEEAERIVARTANGYISRINSAMERM